MDLSQLALAACAVLLAHTVRSAVGFGSALISVPLLTLLVGPVQAMLINALLESVSGFWLLRGPRAPLAWPLLAALMIPMGLGLAVGLALADLLSAALLGGGIGVLVVSYGLILLVHPVGGATGQLEAMPHRGRVPILASAGAAGSVTGVLLGLTGIPGPLPVVVMRRSFADAFFRIQSIAFYLGAAIFLALALMARGEATATTGWMSVALLPPLALGTWLGGRASKHLAPATFGRLVGGVLVVAGGVLIRAAASGALG